MYRQGNEDYSRHVHYFGQEINNQTYNLARMNMMLHRVPASYQHPYSLKWNALESLITDTRFSRYERIAPKSAADYAFLLHGFYHLKTDGVMGIVLPHGVLFRGAAEGTIRQHLIEDGSIYAVIGLPSNLFFNTSIPTCIIILKKDNPTREILFIDASKDFVKEKARNILPDEAIEKILKTYSREICSFGNI